MSFLDKLRNPGRPPRTPEEADALALRQLAARDADLTIPRHVIHVLYFATEDAARAAATDVEAAAWTVAVEAPASEGADWSVRADDHRVVGAETVAAFRSWFEHVADGHGGEYDGWEAAAKP